MTEETRKTIKVRIAVAVAENGWWEAKGWKRVEPERDGAMAAAVRASLLGRSTVVHFVEAEIPVPVTETIEGTVVR